MRHTFYLLALLCGLPTARAQLTLTNGYFPQVGDSLLTNQAEGSYLANVDVQAPGAGLEWDFGYPDAHYEYTEVLEAVVNDTLFTTADARLTSAAFTYEYYQSTPTEYRMVGLVGSLPFFRELVLATPLSPPRTVRRAGITYGDRFEHTSVRTITLSVDSLPAEVRNGEIGSTLASFDSIRVTSTSVRQDVVDAWGTLRLEGYAYAVLREKRVEQMETRLYVKGGDGPYLDVTALALQADPSTSNYLGPQPTQGTYFFWAQDIVEPIVELEFDAEEKPTTFLYKRDGLGTATRADPRVTEIGVYPNPVTDAFRLTFTLAAAGRVACTLRDARGRVLYQWPTEQRGGGRQQLHGSLSGYPHGTYLLVLKTPGGCTVEKIIK